MIKQLIKNLVWLSKNDLTKRNEMFRLRGKDLALSTQRNKRRTEPTAHSTILSAPIIHVTTDELIKKG